MWIRRSILKLALLQVGAAAISFTATIVSAQPQADVRIAGVPAKVERVELKISDPELMSFLQDADGGFGYDIVFGRLTEDQFNVLRSYFNVTRNLSFNAGTSYSLVSFLPVKMQALVNLRLEDKFRKEPYLDHESSAFIPLFYKNSGEIYSTINCWGTAMELTRDASENTPFVTYMASRRQAQVTVENPAYSSLVDMADAKFGDVLVLYASPDIERTLQHVAIYLGDGYVFERTDGNSPMFFRIVHMEDMQRRLKTAFADYYDPSGHPRLVEITYDLRRFNKPDKSRLPHPAEIFSVAAIAPDSAIQEFVVALPPSEDKRKITFFADGRMGGGDDTTIQDIVEFTVRINASTGRGEIDPRQQDATRFRTSD